MLPLATIIFSLTGVPIELFFACARAISNPTPLYPPPPTHTHTHSQVRALAADPKYALLHELLTIFACRGLDDYCAFSAANTEFIASIGVDHEASLRTMRLLTLCSLASGKTSLSYDAIVTALSVSKRCFPSLSRLYKSSGWVEGETLQRT